MVATSDAPAILPPVTANDPPRLRRGSAIPDEMKVGARHLRALAALIDEHVRADVPFAQPGSVAAADLQDRSFDGPWGHATHEVVHEVGAPLNAAADHLHAMAAVVLAPGTVLALSTLTRTVLETLARTCWLYEPGITTRERVRRVYSVRLVSLGEQLNLVRGIAAPASERREKSTGLEKGVFRIKAGARGVGLNYVSKPNRVPGLARKRYIEREVPRDQRLITEMFQTQASQPGSRTDELGPVIHRLTSATAHGQPHGMLMFVLGAESIPATDGVVDVQLALDLSHFANLVGSVVLAVNATSERLCAYYGWPTDPWKKALRLAGESVHEWMERDRRRASRTS